MLGLQMGDLFWKRNILENMRLDVWTFKWLWNLTSVPATVISKRRHISKRSEHSKLPISRLHEICRLDDISGALHYCDVIMGPIAYQITSLTIVYSFIQRQIKENIKAPRHWPLCGEFTGDRWIPAQMASNAENVSIWWRHHGEPLALCMRNIRKDRTTVFCFNIYIYILRSPIYHMLYSVKSCIRVK